MTIEELAHLTRNNQTGKPFEFNKENFNILLGIALAHCDSCEMSDSGDR